MFQSKEKTEAQAVPVQMQAEKISPNTAMAIPQPTKSLFEVSSGFSLDEVRVHRQSDYPAQFQARACTVGPDIYLAPGQEASLPHELGHVLQNALHPVKPTGYVGSQPVNTSPVLEREADNLAARIQTGFPTVSAKRLTRPNFGTAVQGDDFSASVSLFPICTGNIPAEALLVDTIKLSGRTDTGIKVINGRELKSSQGDHTIADVLIKKHQKALVREKPIPDFLNVYEQLYNELLDYSTPKHPLFPIPRESIHEQLRIIELNKKISKSNNQIADKFLLLRQGLGSEIEFAKSIAESGTNPIIWRNLLTNIIYLYNRAYGLSDRATTQAKGRPQGKGEANGVQRLKTITEIAESPGFDEGLIRLESLNPESPLNKLIDITSAKRINLEFLIKKFSEMIIDTIRNNSNRPIKKDIRSFLPEQLWGKRRNIADLQTQEKLKPVESPFFTDDIIESLIQIHDYDSMIKLLSSDHELTDEQASYIINYLAFETDEPTTYIGQILSLMDKPQIYNIVKEIFDERFMIAIVTQIQEILKGPEWTTAFEGNPELAFDAIMNQELYNIKVVKPSLFRMFEMIFQNIV